MTLDARDVRVQHILADGTPETRVDAMSRLLNKQDPGPEGDMLATREQSIAHRRESP